VLWWVVLVWTTEADRLEVNIENKGRQREDGRPSAEWMVMGRCKQEDIARTSA
jgi:hypothetical protein